MEGEFPISNAGIAAAFEMIARSIRNFGLPDGVAHRLSVMVDELCSNMIRHDDTLSEADSFALRIERDGELVALQISDPGQAFDPFEHVHTELPEIGGHGISLIKGLSVGAEYSRQQGRNLVRIRVKPEA